MTSPLKRERKCNLRRGKTVVSFEIPEKSYCAFEKIIN